MDHQLIQQLGKRLSLTNIEIEPDPYLLTPEEETEAIHHAIDQAKKFKAYKYSQMGLRGEDIDSRLVNVNWEEEINRAEVLERCNSNKNHRLWEEGQRVKEIELEKERVKEIAKRNTADEIYKLMSYISRTIYGKKLILNLHTLPLIKAVCFFISSDERFETELGFSLQKGLLIRGISGIGKTHVIKCIEGNEINPVLVLSMIEISDEIKQEGEFNIEMKDKNIIYLDDAGTEESPINYYGTKIHFFKNFIETYYLRSKAFNKLIVSTNENWQGIENKYGFRVRSRMQEMFNVINVTGEDMRNPKKEEAEPTKKQYPEPPKNAPF